MIKNILLMDVSLIILIYENRFELGDMVTAKRHDGGYVITRVYDEKYVTIGNCDLLWCFIEHEEKVETKYLTLVDLNDDMSYEYLQKAFFEDETVISNDKNYPFD